MRLHEGRAGAGAVKLDARQAGICGQRQHSTQIQSRQAGRQASNQRLAAAEGAPTRHGLRAVRVPILLVVGAGGLVSQRLVGLHARGWVQ